MIRSLSKKIVAGCLYHTYKYTGTDGFALPFRVAITTAVLSYSAMVNMSAETATGTSCSFPASVPLCGFYELYSYQAPA